MSCFVIVIPLHTIAAEPDGWAWLRGDPSHAGVPAHPPASRPLPSVREVLGALARSGCHGEPWYAVLDGAGGPHLPACPRGDACDGDRDLGEVLIRSGDTEELHLDMPVENVSFRSPSMPAAVLGALAFAEVAGPVMAVLDSSMAVVVINPGDDPDAIGEVWAV